MTRRKADKGWMARHVRDPYVKRAAREGYRSRAAFKLIELDARDRLFRAGQRIVDLGASPGGWSQVAAERAGRTGNVIAVDLLPMQPLPGVSFVHADLRDPEARARFEEILASGKFDLVLSDMAPNLTGIAAVDSVRAQELIEIAIALSAALLKPHGTFVVKLFQAAGSDAVIDRMRTLFRQVVIRKPPASRSRSSEVYAVCRGLIER